MDTLRELEDRLVAAGKVRPDGRVTTEALLLTSAAVALFVAGRERTAGTLTGAVGR